MKLKAIAATVAFSTLAGCATVPQDHPQKVAESRTVRAEFDARWNSHEFPTRLALEQAMQQRLDAHWPRTSADNDYLLHRIEYAQQVDTGELTIEQAEQRAVNYTAYVRTQQEQQAAQQNAAVAAGIIGVLGAAIVATHPQPNTIIIVPARRCNLFGCW